jgi:type I restriction enzyme S subunit
LNRLSALHISHGSSKPGKRSLGRFSRPLLEGYSDCQNQYRIIEKSLAVAEVNPLLQGILALIKRFCVLEQKYKRGLQNRFFFKRSHLSRTISGISSHEVKPLGSKVQINPKTESLPEAFIYIDLECVEAGVLHSKKLISRNSAPSRAQRLLKEGDLIYQMVRPYQKNNYYFQKAFEYPTVASTGYAQIRCSEVDTQFIYEQLSSDYFAREAMLRSTGTGYPAINADDLAEIPIWIPPLDQQEKVGATLSFIGAKIEVHQKMLYALCRVKSSLLQQLFI